MGGCIDKPSVRSYACLNVAMYCFSCVVLKCKQDNRTMGLSQTTAYCRKGVPQQAVVVPAFLSVFRDRSIRAVIIIRPQEWP